MHAIRIDEYYLTEQDERTVCAQLDSAPVAQLSAGARRTAAVAVVSPRGRGVRRRIRILRRVAGLALAA
jgi:hypothetical protein